MPETELIALGRRGETAAISELFERHYSNSLSVARRILYSEAESQDAVQSAYCSAFQRLDTFREEAQFKTWITRIVVNRCLMTIREPWRRRIDSPESLDALSYRNSSARTVSPETFTWWRELEAVHERAFSQLPSTLSAAYSLYAHSEMSIAEVAETLQLTLAAAKSRIFRARAAMRSSLESIRPRSVSRC